MEIVDGNHDLFRCRQRLEQGQERGSDQTLLRCTLRRRAQQRHVERLPLRLRQAAHRFAVDVSEQIGEPRKRESRLRAACAGDEDAATLIAGHPHRFVPDGGLADAGRAGDHECPQALTGCCQKRVHARKVCSEALNRPLGWHDDSVPKPSRPWGVT